MFINKKILVKIFGVITIIILTLCFLIFFNFVYTDGNIVESLLKFIKRTNSSMGGEITMLSQILMIYNMEL